MSCGAHGQERGITALPRIRGEPLASYSPRTMRQAPEQDNSAHPHTWIPVRAPIHNQPMTWLTLSTRESALPPGSSQRSCRLREVRPAQN